jgi:protein TonB
LSKPEPEFSDPALKRHLKGVVGLKVVVDDSGRVSDVSIVKPMGAGLDENAVNFVRTWRFAPFTKDGQPVAVAVFIEVDFQLEVLEMILRSRTCTSVPLRALCG